MPSDERFPRTFWAGACAFIVGLFLMGHAAGLVAVIGGGTLMTFSSFWGRDGPLRHAGQDMRAGVGYLIPLATWLACVFPLYGAPPNAYQGVAQGVGFGLVALMAVFALHLPHPASVPWRTWRHERWLLMACLAIGAFGALIDWLT